MIACRSENSEPVPTNGNGIIENSSRLNQSSLVQLKKYLAKLLHLLLWIQEKFCGPPTK